MKKKINSILEEYSPKLGLDLPYFFSGSLWLGVGQFFNMLKLLILSVLLANFLTKEIFGQYTFVMTILGVAGIFALPGMREAIVKSVAKGNDGTYKKAVKESFWWSWLGSLMLLGVAIYGKIVGRDYGALIFIILAAIYPFFAITTHYTNFFNGKRMFDVQIKLTTLFNIISTIAIGLTIWVSQSVFWIVLATVLIQIVIQGWFTVVLTRKYVENDKVNKADLSFGRKTSFPIAYTTLAERVDNLLVAYFLGFADLAIYAIIILVPNQLKALTNTFTPLILPKLATQNKVSKKKIMRHFWKLFIISVCLVLLYAAIAPFLFKILYPKYATYVWLSVLFNISFLTFPTMLLHVNFVKNNKHKYINWCRSLSSTYLILGSLIWIFFFGLIGAVINRMIYRVLNMLFYLFFNNDYYAHSKKAGP